MAQLPHVLTDLNAFLREESWAGVCNAITLPKIAWKMADQTLSGVAGDIERSLGKLEKLESEFVLSKYSDEISDMVGSPASREQIITIRGAVDVGDSYIGVVVRIGGFWKSMELPEWKPSSETEIKLSVACEHFELEVDGREVVYVDKMTNVIRMAGTDRNKELRNLLGQ